MSYQEQASRRALPGVGTQVTVPSGASSSAVDLSAFLNSRVLLIASVKTHIRAGNASMAAAATTDAWLPAETPADFLVTPDRTHIRVWGTAAGVLSIASLG